MSSEQKIGQISPVSLSPKSHYPAGKDGSKRHESIPLWHCTLPGRLRQEGWRFKANLATQWDPDSLHMGRDERRQKRCRESLAGKTVEENEPFGKSERLGSHLNLQGPGASEADEGRNLCGKCRWACERKLLKKWFCAVWRMVYNSTILGFEWVSLLNI